MTALSYLLGVVVFAVGLVVSVALHELGHLVPGKVFNVKVTQYFVGFGRTLWSRTFGETEYGVKAIPLGGYCKLVGMVAPNPEDHPDHASGRHPVPAQDPEPDRERVRTRNTGMFAQLVSDARTAEYELVEPHDHHRLFYNKAAWKRVVIMGSGVAVNLVLAFVLFAIAFVGLGVPQPSTSVSTVSQCVIAVTAADLDQPQRACRESDPEAPAKAAGLMPGDRFVSVNGQRVTGWKQTQDLIRANDAGTATLVMERKGRLVTLQARTVVSSVPAADGRSVRQAGFLGVGPGSTYQRQGVGYVVSTMASGTWDTLKTIGALPVKLFHVARASVGLEKRDPTGPMSVVGAGRVTGELVSDQQTPVRDRVLSVLVLLAGLNLFLGLINLVPLPPFDGGGIATTVYESLRRWLARLRGRPDPGGFDSAKLLPVTYVMAGLILVMSVILIFADIVAPIQLS